MENRTISFIFLAIIFIILLIWGIGQTTDKIELQNRERYETLCKIGSLKDQVEMTDQIKELNNQQQLCPNTNCTLYFQKQIDEKQSLIDTADERLDCKNFWRNYIK